MKNTITIEDTTIEIDHKPCVDAKAFESMPLFVASLSEENNMLSKVFVDDVEVLIWWENHSSAESCEVLYIPETGMLFVGAGSVSAQINIKAKTMVGINFPLLFWGYKKVQDHVLELGEMESVLYNIEGEFVDKTSVDPPYEYEFTSKGIKFESILVGITWLKFKP